MGLLDGDLAATFASALSGIYLNGTLHRRTLTDDGQGGGSASSVDETVKVQVDQTTQAQRDGDFTDTDQRILVLAQGVSGITTDDEITAGGVRWAIASVSRDPAGAYYDLRGRRA